MKAPGFNIRMDALLRDLMIRIPEFGGLKPESILVSATFARRRSRGGVLAYVLPLRYREGSPVERRVRGTKEYHFAMLPFLYEGREILYIMYFMLPRFMNLGWRDKLETVIHELYHIHPQCNGDLRRLRGRSEMHGKSLKDYDKNIKAITERLLSSGADLSIHDILFYSSRRAAQKWDGFTAKRIREPRPQLLRVTNTVHTPSTNS